MQVVELLNVGTLAPNTMEVTELFYLIFGVMQVVITGLGAWTLITVNTGEQIDQGGDSSGVLSSSGRSGPEGPCSPCGGHLQAMRRLALLLLLVLGGCVYKGDLNLYSPQGDGNAVDKATEIEGKASLK